MMEKLIASMIPVAVQKLRQVPSEERRVMASFIANLCNLYREGDRLSFEHWINQTNLSDDWKKAIISAVWDQ